MSLEHIQRINCEFKCTKQNKYGEYICNSQPVDGVTKHILCVSHLLENLNFYNTLNLIVSSNVLHIPYDIVSLNRKLEVYRHITNYITKHREQNIEYEDKMITSFITSIEKELSELSLNLNNSNELSNPGKLRKQNKSYKYYKNELENHIAKLHSCISEVIIKKNRDTLVSNSNIM
jgi:cell division protein FtsB